MSMILFGFRRPSCSPLRQHWCTKSQSSFSTASGASKQYHYNPAVVFSPPKNRPLLSPLHLKGTASILAPQWRHLSPCLGAALACSPFTGNLMRLGQHIDNCDDISASSISSSVLKHSAKLANLLFFQLIRESPIHITKNKSMPAAYLSPSLIGSVLAMSSSYTTATTRSNDVSMKIRKTLKDDYGIRSNRIDGNQWTGVSMARWMELFPMGVVSASTATTRSDKHALARNPLVSGIWLVALWETAQSKLCLLEFLKAYDRYVVTSNNSDKRSSIFCKNNKWVQAILHDPVAKTEWADQAYHETNDLSQEEAQASLDKLLFYNEKQKNGNFNPTFDPMSDSEHACALEVVCAHYSLQQQPINSKCVAPAGYYGFDGGDAKPDCAEITVREILELLLWDENSGFFDMTRLPSSASRDLISLYEPSPSSSSGKDWFDVLSNMPGCDYLDMSPNGKPYELAPTAKNLSRVLHRLLMGYPQSANDTNWISLEDLARAWKEPKLLVAVDNLTHRSGRTSNQILEHEVCTLQLVDSLNAIEIRLRCDRTIKSGMAVVTHLRQQEGVSIDALLSSLLNIGETDDSGTQALTATLVELLTTPHGCDRRGIATALAFMDTQHKEAVHEMVFSESKAAHKNAVSQVCMLAEHDSELCSLMLPWIVSESPTVDFVELNATSCYDDEIQDMILSLPVNILGSSETIHDALERSLVCHGKVISRWLKLKSSDASILDVVKGLSFGESLSVASLYFDKR